MKNKVIYGSLAVGFAIYLSSCSSTKVETITGPDGKWDTLISCGDVKDCYTEATKICGKYKIVNTSNETTKSLDPLTPQLLVNTVKLLVECEPKP
jgi:hypothetical protein